jgi:murein DD-endopeptidase MepM/ murein hydrolase activator NlpD
LELGTTEAAKGIHIAGGEQHPDKCQHDRDAGEDVSRLGAERALAPHAAKRTSQPAAAAALQKKQEAAARVLAAAKARAQQLALLAKDYSLPVSNYHLTAGFGEGGYRWSNGHTGLDFACAYGSPIRAVATGTVIFAGWDGAYGYKTVIRHLDGTESWYAHQSQILIRRGQVVAGQIIGRVGMTGNTSGPHVHLEIRVNDRPISPYAWLRAHGLRP